MSKTPFYESKPCGDCGHMTLVPTEEGRELIPQLFERYISGESTEDIDNWLKSRRTS
jgi:hypothetical protein